MRTALRHQQKIIRKHICTKGPIIEQFSGHPLHLSALLPSRKTPVRNVASTTTALLSHLGGQYMTNLNSVQEGSYC